MVHRQTKYLQNIRVKTYKYSPHFARLGPRSIKGLHDYLGTIIILNSYRIDQYIEEIASIVCLYTSI